MYYFPYNCEHSNNNYLYVRTKKGNCIVMFFYVDFEKSGGSYAHI